MNFINFSENITRLRHEKKITQEQLADFVGVTKSSVSKWEKKQSMPDVLLLPQLAAFFDVSIDELLGYEPQLSTEQMQKIYSELAAEFATAPFEKVVEKSMNLAKQYYSCYPFIYRICLLLVNHYMLSQDEERQKEILAYASKLCIRISINGKDIGLRNDAIHLNAMITLLMGNPKAVIEALEDVVNPCHVSHQSEGILIKAYQMANEMEKADSYTQISMYNHLLALISGATEYIGIHSDSTEVCDETVERIKALEKAYNLEQLHPNSISLFYYHAAIVYSINGKKEEAINILEKFVKCIDKAFEGNYLTLHGDDYFDKLEAWFEQTEISGNLPRDKSIILDSALQGINNPAFKILENEDAYQNMKDILVKRGKAL